MIFDQKRLQLKILQSDRIILPESRPVIGSSIRISTTGRIRCRYPALQTIDSGLKQ